METNNKKFINNKKLKLDFKDSKYATGRRKKSMAKFGLKRFRKYSCQWNKNE